VPGGLRSNRAFASCCVEFAANVPDTVQTIFYDPQTAGGLLISVNRADADALQRELSDSGVHAAKIGEVVPREDPLIFIAE
jgi:selenide, water dikinase